LLKRTYKILRLPNTKILSALSKLRKGNDLTTFILATKPSKELTKNPALSEAVRKEWRAKANRKCPDVKWLTHYAPLKPYDFIDIYDAPSEEYAAKALL
jgi:hypothetical protein